MLAETFETSLGDLLWAPNHDRSRWFLVVTTLRPENNELNTLLRYCNDVCERFKLPTLYKQSKRDSVRGKVVSVEPQRRSVTDAALDDVTANFHFSIGWQLEAPGQERVDLLGISEKVLEEVRDIKVKFDSVKVKIGNTITSVPLLRSVSNKKTILR